MVLRPAGAASVPQGLEYYIADTGSSFDIVPIRECSDDLLAGQLRLERSLEMSTVNGNVSVNEALRIAIPALEKDLEFALVPNSPLIISIGRRCMLDGFEFHWPQVRHPTCWTHNRRALN